MIYLMHYNNHLSKGFIMPLKEHVVYNGYTYFIQSTGRYYSCGNKLIKPRLLHRKVWFDHHGEIPKGHVVHHIDGNWRNNEISNLEVITVTKHLSDHNKEWRKNPEYVRKTLDGLMSGQEEAKKWHASKEGSEWHSQHAKEQWENKKKSIIKCIICYKERLTPFPTRTKFCSKSCEMKLNYQKNKISERTCIECGKLFIANKYSDISACGYKCANKARGKRQSFARDQFEKQCVICHITFKPGKEKRVVTCSKSCGAKLRWKLKKADTMPS